MANDDFDLGFLDESPKGSEFETGMDGVSRRNTRKATGTGESIAAGNYDQLTFRLPSEYIDKIKDLAGEWKTSQEEVKRWLVGRGLRAVADGEYADTAERVIRRRLEPPL